MENETLVRQTRIIIVLVMIILGLLIYIAVSINPLSEEQPAAVCGIIDERWDDNEMNYRYAADFLGYEFNPHVGKLLFYANCTSCHATSDAKVVGPGLKDILKRIPREPKNWLVLYLQDSDSLRASGDQYAIRLKETYDNVEWNHHFVKLTTSDLTNIVGYISMNRTGF